MQVQPQVHVMGIGAGGTMTDTFFVREDGRFVVGKAPSKPADKSRSIYHSTRDALAQRSRKIDDVTIATHGNSRVVFVAGQVAENSTLDIAGQTSEVLGLIDRLLTHAGARRAHIVSAQIHLVSAGDYAEVIAVWNAWVAPGLAPVRATVGPKLTNTAFKVAIEVTAAFTPPRPPPTSNSAPPGSGTLGGDGRGESFVADPYSGTLPRPLRGRTWTERRSSSATPSNGLASTFN